MDNWNLDDGLLSIRCPECNQRFKLDTKLLGKMVECGSCDHRFRVDGDILAREKKIYPGEHKDPTLEQFSRVPLRADVMPDFEKAPPIDENARSTFIPVSSPMRIVLGLSAGISAALVAVILIFGGAPNGILDGATTENRLIFAGFMSVILSAMLIAATPVKKYRAVLGGILITGMLMTLPFYFKEGVPKGRPGDATINADISSLRSDEDDRFKDIKEEMGYGRLAQALEKYRDIGEADGKTVVGIWLRNMHQYNKKQIFDYMVRTSGASDPSWIYGRSSRDYLMILYDVSPDLNQIADMCKRFGIVENIYTELNVVEVEVDNEEQLNQEDVEKLRDPNHPEFYQLNKRELGSVDLDRAKDAVVRLADVEPKEYRGIIVQQLRQLLNEGDLNLKRDVVRTLSVWAEDGDGSIDAVRAAAEEIHTKGEVIPRSVIDFLVENEDLESIPLINELWLRDAKEWEAPYGDLGSAIEETVIDSYAGASTAIKISAARLLGRVGTSRSIEFLNSERPNASAELAITIEQALEAIRQRN